MLRRCGPHPADHAWLQYRSHDYRRCRTRASGEDQQRKPPPPSSLGVARASGGQNFAQRPARRSVPVEQVQKGTARARGLPQADVPVSYSQSVSVCNEQRTEWDREQSQKPSTVRADLRAPMRVNSDLSVWSTWCLLRQRYRHASFARRRQRAVGPTGSPTELRESRRDQA
jgi:hypothetical protein